MKIDIIQSDLYTLYETKCSSNVPFYAKQLDWDYAYVRVDKFINGIAIGSYFNHPTTYKNRKNDIIFKSRSICWSIISTEEAKNLDIEYLGE
ncbi:hypothetical protein [Romboutsia lituseburensis]|uniref:hypothetical protein n=1 Tax=Romboutsia lituseburensis TaxID=1537 RepID=UPI00215ACC90|nr:hypothetical protein [Romboutsia lituseburensis]MCR8747278.1 hypothetical protein [Romboutsia lituseburensis]